MTVASVITPVSDNVASPDKVVNVGTDEPSPISSCPPVGWMSVDKGPVPLCH